MTHPEGNKAPEIPVTTKAVGPLMASGARGIRRALRPVSRGADQRATHAGWDLQDAVHERTEDAANPLLRALGALASGNTPLSFGRSRYRNRPQSRQNRP